jgi:hypothetical protein
VMPSSFARCLFQNVVLWGILLQHCSGLVPYAVQEWQDGSSLCRLWPASSGTDHCPGSISSADHSVLRLDAGPHAASSVLQKFLLRPLY